MTEGLRRRAFLRRAVFGLAAGAGALTTVYQNVGYSLPAASGLRVLSTKEGVVLGAAARRILLGAVPLTDASLQDIIIWVDGYLARQAEWTQREVKALLQALEHGPPLLTLQLSRFTRLSPEGQDRALNGWAAHRLPLCRQGYQGLKGLVLMAGYRRADFLRSIGYDGPPFS